MFLETGKLNRISDNLHAKTGVDLNEKFNFYEWNNSEIGSVI
jgi:hypothetical protein